MSTEEQQAAIGRTVEQYAASKKKLAALQSEATKIGNSLTEIGQSLRTSHQVGLASVGTITATVERARSSFPTVDTLMELTSDIKTEMEQKQHLRAALTEMGIEPKD